MVMGPNGTDVSILSCPGENQVLDFIDRRLSAADAAAIERHVDLCEDCRLLIAALVRDEVSASAGSLDFIGPPLDSPRRTPSRAQPETLPSEVSSSEGDASPQAPVPEPRRHEAVPSVRQTVRNVTDLLDTYRLIRPLGRGGSGMVYHGYDELLDRPVAIKFLAAHKPSERERHRLLNEARTIARLRHPNVVTIYQVGEVDGDPYLVMELLDGETLRQVKKPLPAERILEIGLGLALGLAEVHRQGLLHRDIKSSNVMLTSEGKVKLIDFGLAKRLPGPETQSPETTTVYSGGAGEGSAGTAVGHDENEGTLAAWTAGQLEPAYCPG